MTAGFEQEKTGGTEISGGTQAGIKVADRSPFTELPATFKLLRLRLIASVSSGSMALENPEANPRFVALYCMNS